MSIPYNPSLPEAQMPKNPQEKKLRRLVFVWLAAPAVCPWTCQDKRHTAIKKKRQEAQMETALLHQQRVTT